MKEAITYNLDEETKSFFRYEPAQSLGELAVTGKLYLPKGTINTLYPSGPPEKIVVTIEAPAEIPAEEPTEEVS